MAEGIMSASSGNAVIPIYNQDPQSPDEGAVWIVDPNSTNTP